MGEKLHIDREAAYAASEYASLMLGAPGPVELAGDVEYLPDATVLEAERAAVVIEVHEFQLREPERYPATDVWAAAWEAIARIELIQV